MPSVHPWTAWNPHLRFYNNQRGYVRTRITAGSMTADFRVLPYVTTAGAPAHTRATFVIEDRVAGLQQTADVPTPAAAMPPATRPDAPPTPATTRSGRRPRP